MRTRYRTVKTYKTYFATSAVVNWIPIFCVPNIANIVLDSFRFLHDEHRMKIHAYVLMENHFHLIGTSDDFSGEIRKMKSFTAKCIIDYLIEKGPKLFLEQLSFYKSRNDQEYQVWQEGFHPKAILNEKMMTQKTEYIHNNPVRRGYVDRPEHWRYSSCRNYLGQEGLIAVVSFV